PAQLARTVLARSGFSGNVGLRLHVGHSQLAAAGGVAGVDRDPFTRSEYVSGSIYRISIRELSTTYQYYMKGAQGDYLDNIHYYFTGSLNTLLDYHSFDPVNLPFPGETNSCYTWTDPVTKETPECFTAQDLQAVAQQLSTELVD